MNYSYIIQTNYMEFKNKKIIAQLSLGNKLNNKFCYQTKLT